MARELEGRGFKVLTSIADWSRGQKHQNEYLLDQIKVSKELSIYQNPHVFYVEDDSIVSIYKHSLAQMLGEMIGMIDHDPNVLSVRFMRSCDWPPSGKTNQLNEWYFNHEHINFQPLIMRSMQFYTMLKTTEDHLNEVSNIQIEMLWRLILAPYSRNPYPHLVFYPHIQNVVHGRAESIHLGVPNYLDIKKSLNLS